MATSTVPIFDPQGVMHDVPYDQMNAAVQGGGKPAVLFQTPTGEHKYVPADQVQSAVQAGGKILPYEQQEVQHPSIWQDVVSQIKDVAAGVPSMMKVMAGPTPVPMGGPSLTNSNIAVSNPGGDVSSGVMQGDAQRQEEGHGLPYRAGAAVADTTGAASSMEQSAREGDTKGVLTHAATGAALATAPLVLEGATRGAAKVAESEPVKSVRTKAATGAVSELIRPAVSDTKFGREPAAAISREGITANSLQDLQEKTYARTKEVGSSIDKILQSPANASKVVDVSPAVQPITDAMAEAVRAGDKGLYDRLNSFREQFVHTWGEVEEGGNRTIQPTGLRQMQMSPYDATQLKRAVADSVKWTGNDPFEDTVNGVKAKVFGRIKDLVNQSVPEVAEANKRYSDLVGANKAIERRIPVAQRQAHLTLSDIALAGLGDITGGAGTATAAVLARKALSSTAVRTRVAKTLMPDKYAGLPEAAPTPAESTVGAQRIQGTGGQPIVYGDAKDILSGFQKAGLRSGLPGESVTAESLAEQARKVKEGYVRHGSGANYTKDDLAEFKRKHNIR